MRFEDLLAVSSDANRFCVPGELEVVAGLLEGSVLIVDGVLLTSMLLKSTRFLHGEAKGSILLGGTMTLDPRVSRRLRTVDCLGVVAAFSASKICESR